MHERQGVRPVGDELVQLASVRDRHVAAELVELLRQAGVPSRNEPTGRVVGERGVYVQLSHVERAELIIEQYREREGVGAMDIVLLRGLDEETVRMLGSTSGGKRGGAGVGRWGSRGVMTVAVAVLGPVGLVLTVMFAQSNQHAAVRVIGPMMLAAAVVCVAAVLTGRDNNES